MFNTRCGFYNRGGPGDDLSLSCFHGHLFYLRSVKGSDGLFIFNTDWDGPGGYGFYRGSCSVFLGLVIY
jgi:hypothetical protein